MPQWREVDKRKDSLQTFDSLSILKVVLSLTDIRFSVTSPSCGDTGEATFFKCVFNYCVCVCFFMVIIEP